MNIYQIDYEIEKLQQQKEELKKQAIEELVKAQAKYVVDDNPELNLKHIERFLKLFATDVKNILNQ